VRVEITNITDAKMDKTVFQVAELEQESDERAYWKQQSPADRLLALELLRQVMYGYDPLTDRLQRVLTISDHPCD
jgi:hypothetical protein